MDIALPPQRVSITRNKQTHYGHLRRHVFTTLTDPTGKPTGERGPYVGTEICTDDGNLPMALPHQITVLLTVDQVEADPELNSNWAQHFGTKVVLDALHGSRANDEHGEALSRFRSDMLPLLGAAAPVGRFAAGEGVQA